MTQISQKKTKFFQNRKQKHEKKEKPFKTYKILTGNKVGKDEQGTNPMDSKKCIEIQFTATKNS